MLRLKELRKEKGLNQKDCAQHIGVAQNTLSQYEGGKREPDNAALLRIAEFFDVTVDYLLGNSDQRRPEAAQPTEDDIRFALFHGAEGITDEAYEEVKRFAEFVKQKYQSGQN